MTQPSTFERSSRSNPSITTSLHGRTLLVARAVWLVLSILSLALFVIAIPARAERLLMICPEAVCVPGQLSAEGLRALERLGFSLNLYVAYLLALEIGFPLVMGGIGAFIFWRKSDDWMAMLVSFMLVNLGTTIGANLDALSLNGPVWRLLVIFARSLGLGSLILTLIFPNGRFVPDWTRLLIIPLVVWILILPLTPMAYPSLPALLMILVWLGIGAYAQLYRYHRVSSPIEQQQTKWIVFGFAAACLGYLVGFLFPPLLFPSLISPPTGPVFSEVGLLYVTVGIPLGFGPTLLVPLCIAFSILRYRLWDIDIIIRRTLIYAALTSALALVYFASVVGLQLLFRVLTGQRQTELVTVLSTLAIAALFIPLRNGVQSAIDRRFYRRKYNAARILAQFGMTVRDEVDLNRLSERLLEVVDETMQPTQISLWLKRKK